MANVVIVGAGASGLAAAISAARGNNRVILLERNSVCGKKILMTGNGRCNYYNDDINISHYHSNDLSKLNNIITKDNLSKVLSFFDSIGIIPKIKDGYYYPNTNQAITFRNSLLTEALSFGVDICYDTYVKDIEKDNNTFRVITNNNKYICDKVIISTGGKSYPITGSDGNGYSLLEKLGHSKTDILPSLVQLKGNGKFLKKWSGIRVLSKVSLYEDDKFIKDELGEIQLTDYGISGICVMQLSSIVTRGINTNKSEKIFINFLPDYDEVSFSKYLEIRNNKLKNRSIYQLLEGIVNYKLLNVLFEVSKLDKNKKLEELSDIEKNMLIKNIISFSFEVSGINFFDRAQVCAGGIPLSEVNLLTMESMKVKNLYITGEVLDVDGDCGGYNLCFAFLTGIIAGENI